MSVVNRGDGKARLTMGNDKSLEAGVRLKAFAVLKSKKKFW